MSFEPTLKDVFETLVELRKEFNDFRENAGKRSAGGGGYSSSSSSSATADAEIPQPDVTVDSPGDVQVHFGKNNGKPLSELSERSLSWYASEQPPRLDSSGKPYPPRPQETILKNAARQLWHLRKGTLKGVSEQIAAPAASAEPKAAPAPVDALDENVPF